MKKIIVIISVSIGLFLIELAGFTAWRLYKSKSSVNESGTGIEASNTEMQDTTEIKTSEVTFEPEIYQPALDSQLAEILDKYSDAELTMTPEQIVAFEKLSRAVDEKRQKEWESLTQEDSSTFIDSVTDLPESPEELVQDTTETIPEEVTPPPPPEPREDEQQIAEAKRKALRKMAKIYSEMEAAKAAEILQKMNTEDAVQILSNMRERSAAEIMNLMDPYKVIKISKQMTSVHDG